MIADGEIRAAAAALSPAERAALLSGRELAPPIVWSLRRAGLAASRPDPLSRVGGHPLTLKGALVQCHLGGSH